MSEALAFRPERRIGLLAVGSLVVLSGLVIRLADLQLLRHSYYAAVAENQRQRAAELAPHRGTIYVREGRGDDTDNIFPVAANQKSWIAYAVPRDMEDPSGTADQLAPALHAFRLRQQEKSARIIAASGQNRTITETPDENPDEEEESAASTEEGTEDEVSEEDALRQLRDELAAKFNRRTDPYEPLLRPYEVLDEELRAFLEEKQFVGITLEEQEGRIYPEKTLAAHVLGYVGHQDEGRVGRYGVEGFFEPQLAGSQGLLTAERDTAGRFIGIGNHDFAPAQDGQDLVLTIDRVVQSFIEDELRAGVERFAAERGSIIVMNPKTGDVIGMATYPTFDPNYYYAIKEPRVQLNPIVSEIFEPGSILKPLVMAAAMEEGKIEPTTTMVDNGPIKVDKYTINTFDGKHYGVTTMTEILEQSNNVGMVWVGQQLGAETMYDYFRRFGLGERTGIELEGETQTNLPEPSDWNITTVATTSFGQGIAVTPLQALNSINALANNGVLMQPKIIDHVRTHNGDIKKTAPAPVRQVVSPETAEKLSAMMVSVIENGVATLARVPGYYLAGKTGTAQVPDERGRYSDDRKIISFVGYGPVEDPQFSILIKLDNPAGLSFASGTAAPMFRNVAEKLLNYYQIPPSYDPATKSSFPRPGNSGT